MKKDFKEVMSKRTDEQLIKIIKIDRDGYEPEAVLAAEEELAIRGIDESKIEEIKQEEAQAIKLEAKINSDSVSSGIRCLNFLIDFVIIVIMLAMFNIIIGILIAVLTLDLNYLTLKIISYTISISIFFFYYIFSEYKYQKTIAKAITKTKVVTYKGEKPTLSEISARTFYRIIPFDRISFLFTKNGIHDYLSKTKVIKDN